MTTNNPPITQPRRRSSRGTATTSSFLGSSNHHHASDDAGVVAAVFLDRGFVLDPLLPWGGAKTDLQQQPPQDQPDDQPAAEDLASVAPIEVPLVTARSWGQLTFTHAAAEAEYARFVYRRGNARDAIIFGVGTASVLAVIASNPMARKDVAYLLISCAGALILFVQSCISARLELLFRRELSSSSVLSGDRGEDLPFTATAGAAGTSSTAERDHLVAKTEAKFANRRRWLVLLPTAVNAALVWAALSVLAGRCNITLAPGDSASRYDGCVFAYHHSRVYPASFLASFVQSPIEFLLSMAPSALTAAVLQWWIVADRYERPQDTAVQLILFACFTLIQAVLVHVRDMHARSHFGAIVMAHMARRRTLVAHRETAIALSALLPAQLARRAARIRLVGPVTPGGKGQSQPDVASLIGELHDAHHEAAVAVTEAVDLSAFRRRFPDPRMTVMGLCHLFTLFDVGARIFGVERAAAFGDMYVASVVLGRSTSLAATPATTVDLARYALWQLGLDEIRTMPLRSCVVTGLLRGAVVGSAEMPRYIVGGPALHKAMATIQAVPAQQVWACIRTCEACRVPVTDEGQEFTTVIATDLVSGQSAPLVENFLALSVDSDGVPRASDATQTVSTVAARKRPSPQSDDYRPGTTAHYSADSDMLVRATLADRKVRRDSVRSSSVALTSASGVERPQPQNARNPLLSQQASSPILDAMSHDNGSAALTADDADEDFDTEAGTDAKEEAALLAMTGWGRWRFASDAMERDFQAQPRSLLKTSAAMLALFVLFVATAPVHYSLAGRNHMSEHGFQAPTSSEEFIATALLSAVLVSFVISVACEAYIAFQASPSVVQDAHRIFMFRASLVVVPCGMLSVAFFFMPSSPIRNDPVPIAAVLLPLLVWNVFDRVPWWLAAASSTMLLILPMFSLIFLSRDPRIGGGIGRMVVASGVAFAAASLICLRRRFQFADHKVAQMRADAVAAASERLAALLDAFVPPHVTKPALEAAGAVALRQRLLTVPGGAPSTYDNAADEQNVDAKLEELAAVLRGDYGDEPVYTYTEIVVGHIKLRGSAYSADTDAGELTAELWQDIAECLGAANDAYTHPSDEAWRLDGARSEFSHDDVITDSAGPSLQGRGGDASGVHHRVPPQRLAPVRVGSSEGTAFDRPVATMHQLVELPAPVLETDNRASNTLLGASSSELALPLPGGRGESRPLMLVSHLSNRLVVAGPLSRHTSGSDTLAADAIATSAGATAHFVSCLAERVARRGTHLACGLAVGEAAAALMGRGAMRYGVSGVAADHARALAEAATAAVDIRSSSSLVAATAHFHSRCALAGERAFETMKRSSHAWCVQNMGHIRPHLWTSSPASPLDRRAAADVSGHNKNPLRGAGPLINSDDEEEASMPGGDAPALKAFAGLS